MHWSKKNKGIVIFLIVIVAVVLLCLGDYGLRYYDTPKEETYDYVGSGMLVGLANPQFYQQVPVEIHAKKAHFIWKNQEDYIQGNVWLDGEKIFGDEETGFTTLFVKAEPSYSCITTTDGDTAGNMFLISKDLKTVLCGVKIEEEEFLLVAPAEDKATADGMIDNAAKQSQAFSWWLLEVYKDIIKDTVK